MRYAALILNAFAMLLLVWAGYGVFQLTRNNPTSIRPLVTELVPLPLSFRNDQARVMAAFDSIQLIQTHSIALGVEPQKLIALPIPGSEVMGSIQMPRRSMSLYLDDLVSETQTVVIDGQLVRKGAKLQDGGRVVQVKPNEVVVTERLGKQKLSLLEQSLHVGTLRWPDGSLASINTQQFRAGLLGGQPAIPKVTP